MPITTLADAKTKIVGTYPFSLLAGTYYSLYATGNYISGNFPIISSAPSPGMSGVALTSPVGFPFTNPTSGYTYIAGISITSPTPIACFVYDRLWHNSGIAMSITTEQAINSVTLPARDENGTTNGDGVYVGLEVSGITSNVLAVATLSYTNSNGVSGRVGTMIKRAANQDPAGSFFPFSLMGADRGVRSIQGITFTTAWTSGTVHLVMYRQLAIAHAKIANKMLRFDALQLGMPRMWDNSVPCIMACPIYGSSSSALGSITFAQG